MLKKLFLLVFAFSCLIAGNTQELRKQALDNTVEAIKFAENNFEASGKILYFDLNEQIVTETAVSGNNFKSNEPSFPVVAPFAVDNDASAEITWSEPAGGVYSNFRFDSGIAGGQLGFSGEMPRGVVGTCHRVNAEIEKIQWFLTNQPLIKPTHVNIYIFDLDELGQPTNNILYSAYNVPTTVMEWCEYQLSRAVLAPNGFFMALSRPSGSNLALGTTVPTEEYPFQPNTHFFSPDYETANFIAVTTTLYNVNIMIRSEGYILNESAEFPQPSNYRVYRLLDGDQNNETAWTTLNANVSGLSYTDNGWESLNEGYYRWAIKAEYAEETSVPRFTNVLPKGKEFNYTVNLTTNTGDPVAGAIIILTNQDGISEHVYTQTATNAAVNFTKVWKGTYNILIKLKNFVTYLAKDVIIEAQGLSHNAELIESVYPVINPTVEIIGNDAVLSWEEPQLNQWIKQCRNDEIAWRFGWSEEGGNNMTAAIRFLPSDLATMGIISGYQISKIALGTGSHLWAVNVMDIRIWEGGTSVLDAGRLVYTQPVTNYASFTEEAFNIVELTTPFTIDASKELRIGYRLINTAGYPFGADNGPNVSLKGALFQCPTINQGQWFDIKIGFNYDWNFSIKALVTDVNLTEVGALTYIDSKTSFPKQENNSGKSLLGYKVYRLTAGQPQSQWTLLSDNVTELSFIDNDWSSLPYGLYQWAVKAKYSSGDAEAMLTDIVAKDMEVEYTVKVTSNSNDPVVDAVVTLTNISGNPNHVYRKTVTDNENLIFDAVWRGTYDISVKLAGFQPYSVKNVVINQQGTHNAELIEILYPVQSLKAEKEDDEIFISWEEPSSFIKTVFRYDSGICNGQLGFNGYAPNGVIGSCHRVNAELLKIQWFLTDEAEPASHVDIYIFALNAQGRPTNTIIYSALMVPTTILEWNEYEFPVPVQTPNGFFMALARPTGSFLSLGTTLPNSEYPFIQNTQYFNANYTQQNFATLESNGMYINLMLRAEGYIFDSKAGFGFPQKSLQSYTIYRLNEAQPETAWTLLSDVVTDINYTDRVSDMIISGRYQWAVKANYTSGKSAAQLTNPPIYIFVPGHTVTFNVFNSKTFEPITDAIIIFDGDEMSYVIENVNIGVYEWTVFKTGFYTQYGTLNMTGENTTIDVPLVEKNESIDSDSFAGVILYPNPFKNEIFVIGDYSVTSVQITNSTGQILKNIMFNGKTIATEDLSRGVYFVTIECVNGKKTVFKMIK